MHLRHADGQVAAEVPQEPAQVLVRSGRRCDDQRRLRGVVQPEAAAAGAAGAARFRLYADLSLPRLAGAKCARTRSAPGRSNSSSSRPTNSIKLTRNPDYWKKGLPLSRRHRVHHHPEPLDRDPRLRRRQVRHDVPDRGDDPAAQGRQVAGPQAICVVEPTTSAPTSSSIRRRRRSTISTFATRWRWRSTARPSSTDPVRGPGRYRRHHAAGAGRAVEHAEGDAGDDPRLRTRRRSQPRGGAQADGEGGLRPEQAPAGQGFDPQHSRSIATPP